MGRKRALFESWRGRYNDNPKAISDQLASAAPEIDRLWVSSPRGSFPSGTSLVPRHTPRYFLELLRCDLLVTNDIVSRHLVKGPRVVYLQSWHGSPIKVIGLHESTPAYQGGEAHLARMRRDVSKWDYLISPCPAFTDIFRGAFGYEGEILEVGYPRNDILLNDDGTRRVQLRRALGLEPAQLAVLYAPTWRDDAALGADGFHQPELIDWDALLAALPDGSVVLNRLHQHAASVDLPDFGGRLIDVSRHEDMAELILASDVLVSDYSSVIYDYAVWGRPIILHAPDLAHYRDQVRGLYFDYEPWAPGPVTSTTGELADALGSLTEIEQTYAKRYADFVATYCTFENGRAAESVVSTLIERHLG